MKFFVKLLILFFLFSGSANAQKLPADASQIIQKIASGSEPLTREEYDGFWNSLGPAGVNNKAIVIGAMRGNFVLLQKFQHEIWTCAEASWILRVEQKCPRAKSALAKVKSKRAAGQEGEVINLEDDMKNLIKAAANRGTFRVSGSQFDVQLSLEMIRSSRVNIAAMLKRFERVLQMEYNPSTSGAI